MSAWQHTHPRGMARDEIEHAVSLGQISDLDSARNMMADSGMSEQAIRSALAKLAPELERGAVMLEERLAGGQDCDTCGLPVCACEGPR